MRVNILVAKVVCLHVAGVALCTGPGAISAEETAVDPVELQRERSHWVHERGYRCNTDLQDTAASTTAPGGAMRRHRACYQLDDCRVECLNTPWCWGVERSSTGAMTLLPQSCTLVSALVPAASPAHSVHLLRPPALHSGRAPTGRVHWSLRADPPIFPLPASYLNGSQPVVIDVDSFRFVVAPASAVDHTDPVLKETFARTAKILFGLPAARTHHGGRTREPRSSDSASTNANPNRSDTSNTGREDKRDSGGATTLARDTRTVSILKAVHVTVASSDTTLQLGVSEQYTLDVEASGEVRIAADTVYGVIRALDTFAQLVVAEHHHGNTRYMVHRCPWHIKDAPRFPHRGLLVDTGRHFLPPPTLRAVIDSMVYVKLNTLHWHLYDFESFPLESLALPRLWDAAFSAGERYTQHTVREIVEYARVRGIRVVVELDSPSHASSWCVGYPELCPLAACDSPMNVANSNTITSIKLLMEELLPVKAKGDPFTHTKPPPLFHDTVVHLGGDEVELGCLTASTPIRQWLASRNMTAADGISHFMQQVVRHVTDHHGLAPTFWDEVFTAHRKIIPPTGIVQVWRDKRTLQSVVRGGHRAILSNHGGGAAGDESWYLDQDGTAQGAHRNEPCNGIEEKDCRERVLGGEGCMWGEATDGSNILQTIYPRLASIAERLWSPVDTQYSDDRLKALRCRLLSLGVGSARVNASQPDDGSCAR